MSPLIKHDPNFLDLDTPRPVYHDNNWIHAETECLGTDFVHVLFPANSPLLYPSLSASVLFHVIPIPFKQTPTWMALNDMRRT